MASERMAVISLSTTLVKKLQTCNPQEIKSGVIMGFYSEDQVICIGSCLSKDLLPAGFQPVGAFCFCPDESSTDKDCIIECESSLKTEWQVAREEELAVVLIIRGQSNESPVKAVLYSIEYGTISTPEVQFINDNDIFATFAILRAKGLVSLTCQAAKDNEEFRENLSSVVDKLRTSAKNGMLAFNLKNSPVLLTHDEQKGILSDYIKLTENPEDNRAKAKKKRLDLKDKDPVQFQLVLKVSNIPLDEIDKHTPVIDYHRNEFTGVSIPLVLDLIALARVDDSLQYIYQILVDAFLQQLALVEETILKFKKCLKFSTIVPYHCWPSLCAHPVTVFYPKDVNDDLLVNHREVLHHKLLLPTDRPYLRKLNDHTFGDEWAKEGYLRNTHNGLPLSNEPGSHVSVVSGTYSYHHYMQDHMDDNGWGCAYRSLQTIVSWFRHQGYTSKHVPSHKEIQQTLVDVGDKPKSFVGSRLWIGSQEVSFVLNQWIEVTSKIMFVSSGGELANKGRELLNHFNVQGTPVMIGGGVLAHTILGVEYNENSGNIRFLILDPHYTGAEDLNVIQNKGWCGWKNSDFWDKTAFYNLCLPQRPLTF